MKRDCFEYLLLFAPVEVTDRTKERHDSVVDISCCNKHIPSTQDYYILQKI